MNDGSAVVFYHIFSLRFLYEMGISGVGEDVNWGQGFLLFFRLSLGGACIGIAFGVGLLVVLYNLNRRLSGEDSVVQVVATITAAYLSFFTSEILAKCSGIIAVLFCGVVTKAFGETYYNDPHLSLHFWEITEYLLNTLLFALGGCVWGDILSTKSYGDDTMLVFNAKDWVRSYMNFLDVCLLDLIQHSYIADSFSGVSLHVVCLCCIDTFLPGVHFFPMHVPHWHWTKYP